MEVEFKERMMEREARYQMEVSRLRDELREMQSQRDNLLLAQPTTSQDHEIQLLQEENQKLELQLQSVCLFSIIF